MRRFYVWLDKDVPGTETEYTRVEMPDDATDEQCDAECGAALDTMIGNQLDTGWNELEPDEDYPEGA